MNSARPFSQARSVASAPGVTVAKRSTGTSQLTSLAKAAGLMPSYINAEGKRTKSSPETLLAALRSLGVEVDGPNKADAALRALLREQASRALEPVNVVWLGKPAHALFRLKTDLQGQPKASGSVTVTVETEQGDEFTDKHALADARIVSKPQADGSKAHFAKLKLPRTPLGYHTLRTKAGSSEEEALLICAPEVSYQAGEDDEREGQEKSLGLFCPTYAIRSGENLGVGNLSDLRELAAWADKQGCDLISTLPLLSVFLDDSPIFEPGPYSPVSRLFWNELFLDPYLTAAFEKSKNAKKLAASAPFKKRIARLQADTDRVDHREAARLQRELLDALAQQHFSSGADKADAFQTFLAENPLAPEYARFRAVTEQRGESWRFWPKRMRDGKLRATDADPQIERRHLYAQFAMSDQLRGFKREMADRDGKLYLDLAIGVHPDGFDVWHDQQAFLLGSVVGAPPDPMFTQGQNWGFPPMHPNIIRERGYRGIIDALRSHMRYAHFLRLDHVMGFHRLYLIPEGMPATDGVYARYNDEELFAILSLESHRNKCRLIGENLGTVPKQVEKLMTKHKVGKLYVGIFQGTGDAKRALNPVPRDVAASLNTHDLPPFAKNFVGDDLEERIAAGVFNPDLEKGERDSRDRDRKAISAWLRSKKLYTGKGDADPTAAAINLYRFLAESDAELALVNIEDLWGETRWQNMPGTTVEYPNWQHKLAKTLDEIESDPSLGTLLRDLAKRRAGAVSDFTPRRRRSKKR
jgi:4-alpha-glucanotransferase